MQEKIIEIPTADGRMETFIIHPEVDGELDGGRMLIVGYCVKLRKTRAGHTCLRTEVR